MTLGLLRNRDPSENTPEVKPPKKRWISIGIIAVIVLCLPAVAVYLLTGRSEGPAVLTYAVPTDQQTSSAAAAGRCDYPEPPTTDVTGIVPPDVRWELMPGTTMAAPRSGVAGPSTVEGNITSCYARTPSGALLAAANLLSEMRNYTLDMDRLVSTKVTHTTGYDALNQRVQAWEGGDTSRAPQPVQQIAGYRFLQFTGDWAVIEIVIRNTSGELAGAMASVSYALAWEDDDWKLVPPLDGGNVPSLRIDALEYPYVAFGGA